MNNNMRKCILSQIEVVNDRIGMVYSGMGPDFRYVTISFLSIAIIL